jgi:hypothetical protein
MNTSSHSPSFDEEVIEDGLVENKIRRCGESCTFVSEAYEMINTLTLTAWLGVILAVLVCIVGVIVLLGMIGSLVAAVDNGNTKGLMVVVSVLMFVLIIACIFTFILTVCIHFILRATLSLCFVTPSS